MKKNRVNKISRILIMTVIMGLYLLLVLKGYEQGYGLARDAMIATQSIVTIVIGGAVSEESKTGSGLTNMSKITRENTANLSMEKIITKVNLEVETQEFDDLIGIIKDEIADLGAMMKELKLVEEDYSRNNSRDGYIVARIPRIG